MIRIGEFTTRRVSFEDFEVEIKAELDSADELVKVAQVLSGICDDNAEVAVIAPSMESLVNMSHYRVSLESGMIAAAIAAGVAVLALVYKLFQYFRKNKTSDKAASALAALANAPDEKAFENATTEELCKSNYTAYLRKYPDLGAPFENFVAKFDFGKSLDALMAVVDTLGTDKEQEGAVDKELTANLSSVNFAKAWGEGNNELVEMCKTLGVTITAPDETVQRKWLFKQISTVNVNSTVQTSEAYNALVKFLDGTSDKPILSTSELYKRLTDNKSKEGLEALEKHCEEHEKQAEALEKKVQDTLSKLEKVRDDEKITLAAVDASALSGFMDYIKNVNVVYKNVNAIYIRSTRFFVQALKNKSADSK